MSIVPSTGLRTFILSAQRGGHSPSGNSHRHNLLMQNLAREFARGHVFALHQCRGHYKGVRERSIAVLAPAGWIDKALFLARSYDQESVLVIDELSVGRLCYCTHRDAGQWDTLGEHKELSGAACDYDHTHVLGTGHRFTFV